MPLIIIEGFHLQHCADPSPFLQPRELDLPQFTRTSPQAPILRILFIEVTAFQTPKKREMSQSRARGNSNSFNNNSFNNTVSFNNTSSFNNVCNVNFDSADEATEILAWLSPLDPQIRHQNIREHRVEHVGDWLLYTIRRVSELV